MLAVVVVLSIKMIVDCFHNVEVWELGRPIHDWLCFFVCFYCLCSVFVIIAMLKNDAVAFQMVLKGGSKSYCAFLHL